jgi:hypothetical protein
MQIDRNNFAKEMELRKLIREAIKVVESRKSIRASVDSLRKQELRKHIRVLIEAEVGDKIPHQSTGINVLEDLLKKIVPILQDGFYQLTTSQEQRDSFRAHIVKGAQNLLAPTKAIDNIDDDSTLDLDEQEDINVEVGDERDEMPPEFIDIDPPPKEEEQNPEEKKEQEFGIQGMDTTGRNVALDVFKRIETAIVDAFDLLDNEEDEDVFYDYLLTNLKLYMDKFEDDLKTKLPEPTTPEYEEEKVADPEPGDEFGDGLMEFDLNKLKKMSEQ